MTHENISTLIEAAHALLWVKNHWDWFAWGAAIIVACQFCLLVGIARRT